MLLPRDPTDRRLLAIGGVLLAVYLAGTAAFAKPNGRVVFGDATHHFVQLRSLVFDRDLHFQDEYVRIYELRGGEPGTEWIFTDLTSTGHVRNYMPIGPGLLWAPLYLALSGVLVVLGWMGAIAPPDGFETVLQLCPGITGVLAATGAAILAARIARRYVDRTTAEWAVVATWLGTHALYYSLVSPAYSHTASMLAVSAFFAAWIGQRDAPSLARFAGWGALAGIAALMRWQEAVLIVVPLVEAARWRVTFGRRLVAAVTVGAAWLVAFLPQMLVWTVLYGQPFALPQGPSFMQWTDPHLFAVLLSDNHGLFIWAPLLALAAMGLVTFIRRHPAEGLPIALFVLISWYVNGAVADWWAGEAFGARRFLSLFPLFALGLGTWLHLPARARAWRGWKPILTLALCAANALLLFQYELFMKGYRAIAPYPHGLVDMWLTRFVVPVRVLVQWLS